MKKILVGIIIAVAAISIFLYMRQQRAVVPDNQEVVVVPEPAEQTVVVQVRSTIDFGEGRVFEESVADAKTAYDALRATALKNDLEVEIQEYGFGIFVKSIDNNPTTDDRAWIYYVNGASGDVASDQYLLKEGDIVEWRYEEPIY